MDIALSEALNMEVINIKAPEGTAPAKEQLRLLTKMVMFNRFLMKIKNI